MTNAELLWLAVWAGTVLLLIIGWVVRRRREAKTRVEEEIPAEIPRDQLALYIDYSAEKDRLNPRPRAPEQSAEACWVKVGEEVVVSGYTLSRGMLFVGAGYYKDRSAWKPYDFLIDPTRPVSPTEPDTAGRTVSYWPAYSKLTPNARAALLAWLADGARDPAVAIGYVMLYFYGLQHRLLENDPGAEAPALLAELQRLQALYGENAYFAQACATCLEAVAQQERRNRATTD